MANLKHGFGKNISPVRISRVVLLLSFLILNSLICNSAFAEPPRRIVSLAPSITEILFAAGLEDRVVGVTNFCDYPEEAKKKPKIGGMSNPSLEAVVSLKPDIVVMTTNGNPQEFAQRLRSMNIQIYVFKERRLSDLPAGIREMGRALDAEERFNALALNIEKATAKFKSEKILKGEKVVFVIWPEPLIVAGDETIISDAIKLIGGINIADMTKIRYPKYSVEEMLRQAPDVILIGKGHENMKKLSGRLLKRLHSVPAVKNQRVFYVSDSLYRPGPRVIDGLKELAEYLR